MRHRPASIFDLVFEERAVGFVYRHRWDEGHAGTVSADTALARVRLPEADDCQRQVAIRVAVVGQDIQGDGHSSFGGATVVPGNRQLIVFIVTIARPFIVLITEVGQGGGADVRHTVPGWHR
ncbi:hypothetical protein D3C78_1402020 [compost metagenome]